jgi:hypothetical protein
MTGISTPEGRVKCLPHGEVVHKPVSLTLGRLKFKASKCPNSLFMDFRNISSEILCVPIRVFFFKISR